MSERTARDVPPPLAERMRAALAGADASDLGAVTHAALDRLRAALALGDERAAAYELLTADALLTQAAAAAARTGAADEIDAEAFTALLEDG